jgi:hypothetical protein
MNYRKENTFWLQQIIGERAMNDWVSFQDARPRPDRHQKVVSTRSDNDLPRINLWPASRSPVTNFAMK